MFGRGQKQGSESLGYCHELQMAFLWHHRGTISRTDPHNFRKVEQEEVNEGSYWLASETLLLENTGSANLPMFSIWDYIIKTPKGLWRNNKSLLWMDYSAHNIEKKKLIWSGFFSLAYPFIGGRVWRREPMVQRCRSSTSDHSIKRRR